MLRKRTPAIILALLLLLAAGCAGGDTDVQSVSPSPVQSPSFSAEATEALNTPVPTLQEQPVPIRDLEPSYVPPSPPSETPDAPQTKPVFMRAVWVASVLNIDFPITLGDPEAQKAEFVQILDNTLSWNLDTVIVQVRPMGDALYRSELNPWSSFLTGKQGQDPGWDPLEFMTQQAHERGLSLHVWLNPYRVTHTSAGFTAADLAEGSLARQHPEWLIEHEGMLFYDPAREEIKEHIAATVKEIVDRYDVDGVHFDDYFYPTGYPLPEGAERDGIIDRERRLHVTDMLRRVHAVCQQAGHPVVFGVSPFGIWKNASTDPEGSNTSGNESYYSMAADSLTWMREGIIDYIAPQLYWRIGHDKADYATLLEWWVRQTEGTDVSLLIGQGLSYDEVAAEIDQQLALNAAQPKVTGSIFFSYSTFLENPQAAQAIRDFYAAHPQQSAAESAAQTAAAAGQ